MCKCNTYNIFLCPPLIVKICFINLKNIFFFVLNLGMIEPSRTCRVRHVFYHVQHRFYELVNCIESL